MYDYLSECAIITLKPVEFAKNLSEFRDYEIGLEYSYEDMARVTHTRTIYIQESFEEYRQQRIKEWTDNKQFHELAVEAMKSLEIIG